MYRKNVKLIILGILLLVICSSLSIVNANRFNMSYIYGNYNYISLVNATDGALNEVSPSYFDLTSDGNLALNTIDNNFVQEMHRQGVLVVPFLSNHWDREKGRKALANADTLSNQIVNAITQYNLDGVNVDIENVTLPDRNDYTNLVKLIREKLPTNKSVSVAVAANPYNWTSGWHASYDYEKLATYADYLMLMTYDEHYEGGAAGPVSSIDFVEKSIQHALKSVPKEKIVVGIPFFGRYWKDGASYGGYGISLNKVEDLMKKYQNNIIYDNESKSAKVVITINEADVKPIINGRTLTAGTYTIWCENEQSIKAKLELVNKYDLKGTGSWSLGQENSTLWSYYKSALNNNEDRIFKDVQNDRWSIEYIRKVKDNGLMEGKTNDNFDPAADLTRAEFATIMVRLLELTNEEYATSYKDIEKHWAENNIKAVTKAGLMNGYEDGTFMPDKTITREEVAKVISLLNSETDTNITDISYKDLINTRWSYDYIMDVTRKGLMNGYEDNTFLPQRIMTREEIAVVLARIIGED